MKSFFSSDCSSVDVLPLEEALAQSITEKDIQELGLPRYCLPKVIGSLPLKESFSYLPALKRQYIDKALLHLYESYKPKKKAKIVLFTWVIGDGLGDYFAQQETARILQESLPDVEIVLITLVHKQAKIPTTLSVFSQHVVPYEADLSKGWNAVRYEPFSAEVLGELKNASLVIQIPTYFPHTKQLLEQISFKGGPKYELVGEGGWGDTPHFDPLTGARCLGLHFLEKGIFIKKIPQDDFFSSLAKISDPRIRSALQEKDYLATHRFNLAYTRYDVGFYLYLHALLKSLEKDTKNIDVCFFDIKSFAQNIDRWYKPLFAKYGIKEVCLYYRENRVKIPISSKGKTLKLLHIENSKQQDYQLLLSMAQDLVGCRGDGSIFEAISADKVFFLDIALHQKKFLKDLIVLAQFYLPQCPQVAEYFQCFLSFPTLEPPSKVSLEELGEKIGALLQSKQVRDGIKTLNQRIREEHNVNSVLVNMAKRALYLYEHPGKEILEQHALNGFLYGERIPAKEILAEIQDEVMLRPALGFKNI